MSSLQNLGYTYLDSTNNSNIPQIFTELLQNGNLTVTDYTTPEIDMIESQSTICIYVNLAGVNRNSIDADFFNNQLKIRGDRIKPYSADWTVHKNEIMYGPFEKTVLLPISVTNRESVTVNTENGVLEIVINKQNEENNRFSVNFLNNSSNSTNIENNNENTEEENQI